MPTTRICLDCNHLYTPPTNGTTTHGRCPNCHPAHMKHRPRGNHHDTPQRRLRTTFYRSNKWKRTREHIIRRDGQCTSCGTHDHLQVHHIISITDAPHLALDPDNLTTLCSTCHARESNTTKRERGAHTRTRMK